MQAPQTGVYEKLDKAELRAHLTTLFLFQVGI
jgi:hypothetical protein